jgi:hypothetical protein
VISNAKKKLLHVAKPALQLTDLEYRHFHDFPRPPGLR